MSGAQHGPLNPNWRGGRTITPAGYVLIKMPEHPAADVRGYIYEHRLVMEQELDRLLAPGERVRHKDNNPGNNAPDNLLLVMPLDRKAFTTCACGCGAVMTMLDNAGRKRRFLSGHNTVTRGIRVGSRPRSETGAGLDPEWRAEILEEFGGLCAYSCGRLATQWDHLIPWSRGGSFAMAGNAVPACRRCNQSKTDCADPWLWIDRGLRGTQGEALERVLSLALSWGALDPPEDEFPAAAEAVSA
jgi:hypothetical protein